MMKKISLSLFLITTVFLSGNAQKVWTFDECIEYARKNSITIKQAEIGIQNAVITEKNNRMNRYPSLNATVNGGAQFGRTIDPTTNSFDNQTIGFNNLSLNAGILIYGGNRINNSIKQARVDAQVAKYNAKDASNNLLLSVANSYLNILMSEEQLDNAKSRRKLSGSQLKRIDKLIEAGSIPRNDRLNVLSQIATDEQAIVLAQNAVDIGYLQLKNAMRLDPKVDIKIFKPKLEVPADADPDSYVFEEVYSKALTNQPNIISIEKQEESAHIQVDIAKSTLLPSVRAFGGMDSRWSSVSKDFNNPTEVVVVPNVVDVEFNNMTVPLTFNNEIPISFPKISYLDQLNENLGQNLGLNVQIPIYNNHNNRTSVERAKLNVLGAKYATEQAKQQLKADIQTAIANAKAGKLSYKAAKLTYEAAKASYENAEKRFLLGTINSFDLINAKTTLDTAEVEVTRSKFDYVFRLKIVDFYSNDELKL